MRKKITVTWEMAMREMVTWCETEHRRHRELRLTAENKFQAETFEVYANAMMSAEMQAKHLLDEVTE